MLTRRTHNNKYAHYFEALDEMGLIFFIDDQIGFIRIFRCEIQFSIRLILLLPAYTPAYTARG